MMDESKLKIVPWNNNYKSLIDTIQDDAELLRFMNLNTKNCLVAFYENKPIGFCYVLYGYGDPEIQCAIFKEYRGQGYGSLILNNLTNKLFNENYPKTILKIDKNNTRSQEVAKKNGYQIDYDTVSFNSENQDDKIVFYKSNYNYNYNRRK